LKKKKKTKKRKRSGKVAKKAARRRRTTIKPIKGPFQIELPLQMPLFPNLDSRPRAEATLPSEAPPEAATG
jgi:2-succinyl-5-enolpyruvyl-6-hydroxy-3-cyclohexene-1-carboxylate synthase